ncbi:MAG: GspH/FimT family pseudopilin [Nevskiaceae bacterium]
MTIKREAAPGRPSGPVRGYTLVELLATLCIAGVVATVALPSFSDLARNERRTAVVSRLTATLLLARSEALKRGGRPLLICGVADRDGDGRLAGAELACTGYDWSQGWMLAAWADTDGNGTVAPAEVQPVRVFQTEAGGRLTVIAGNFTASPPVRPAGTLLFKSFGRRTSNGTITICDARGPAEARGVIVSSLGRARVSARRSDGTPLRCP